MAYENIGTPSGNNLYITIPVRGTKNWDEKIKDGFFQKVSDHDHTPGKGARITLPALDSTLQNAIAQVSTNTVNIAQNAVDINDNTVLIAANTSNISSNDTDIAALDTRLSTAESNISSNDTDISGLDTRLTTAESSITSNALDITSLTSRVTSLESAPVNEITISSQAEANALAATTENSFVDITLGGINLSGKTFKNCKIALDGNTTFTSCNVYSSDISAKDSSLSDATFTNSSLVACTLNGLDDILFDTNNANTTLNRINIPTSYSSTTIRNMSNSNFMTIGDSLIKGYRVVMEGYNISTTYSEISPVYNVVLVPSADSEIHLDAHTVVKTQYVYNSNGNNYAVMLDPGTDIYSSNNVTTGYINFVDSGSSTIKTGTNPQAYKIINNVATDFDETGSNSAPEVTFNASSSTTETISDKTVFIDMGTTNTTLSNKTFERCSIYVEFDPTYSGYSALNLTLTDCVFKHCSFDSRNGDNATMVVPGEDPVNLILNLPTGDCIEHSTFASRFITINGSASGASDIYTGKFLGEVGIEASRVSFYKNCLLDTNLRHSVTLIADTSGLLYSNSDIKCADLILDNGGTNNLSFVGSCNIECDKIEHVSNANATTDYRLDIGSDCYFFIRKGIITEDITRKLEYIIGTAYSVEFDIRNNTMPLIMQRYVIKPAYGNSVITLSNLGNIFDTGSATTGTIPFYYGFLSSGQNLGIGSTSNVGTQTIAPQTDSSSPSGAIFKVTQTNLVNYNISTVNSKISWNVPAGLGANQYVRIIVEYRDHGYTVTKTDTYTKSVDTGVLEIEDILQNVNAETVEVKFNNDVTDVEFDVKYFKIDFKG